MPEVNYRKVLDDIVQSIPPNTRDPQERSAKRLCEAVATIAKTLERSDRAVVRIDSDEERALAKGIFLNKQYLVSESIEEGIPYLTVVK